MNVIRLVVAASLLTTLSACSVGPKYIAPEPQLSATWQAPLPHEGSITHLTEWWANYNDPALTQLIQTAEQSSPTLTQAVARINQARANWDSTAASLYPSVDLNAKSTRSKSNPFGSQVFLQTASSLSLDAAWEIDLFGASRRARESALAHITARQADWHDARVSLSAEVANSYLNLRACEIATDSADRDWHSRQHTAVLTQLKVAELFLPASDSTLTRAYASDAHNRLLNQQAECELNIKALVALTGIAETALRQQLAPRRAQLPTSPLLNISNVPADLLRQRPDLAAAERDLAAAMADAGLAEANRYPRLSLTGSIGVSLLNLNGVSSQTNTWSFGPALSIPLFDAGKRRANAQLALAKYDEARAGYELKVRNAVKETEQALVRLDSTRQRMLDAQASVADFKAAWQAMNQRYQAGTTSLLEVEDSARNLISAENTLTTLQRDQLTASISLYKAMGGGFEIINNHD